MSKRLFYIGVCISLVAFSSYAHIETTEDEEQLKKEQIFVQANNEEEIVVEQEDEQLACDCKKRKKGKKTATLRFVNMTAEQNDEELNEETIDDEALAWSSFNIFIHTALF